MKMPEKFIEHAAKNIETRISELVKSERYQHLFKPFYDSTNHINVKSLSIFAILFIIFSYSSFYFTEGRIRQILNIVIALWALYFLALFFYSSKHDRLKDEISYHMEQKQKYEHLLSKKYEPLAEKVLKKVSKKKKKR